MFLQCEVATFMTRDSIDMIYSLQDRCYDLQNQERITEFECVKSEADQIIFFIYSEIRKMDINHTVIIDAEDTDVIILSARVAYELDGIFGVKWKKDVFDYKKLCSRDMAKKIVPCYTHTGADTVSAFYGHGKKSVMTNIAKITDFSLSLDKVGMQLPITDSVVDQLRNCIIKSVYNDNKSKTLADARASSGR